MTTEAKAQEDIKRKIKLLLRKAQGGTTPAEMEALMAKAQELAMKHQLTLADLDPNAEEFEVTEGFLYENVRLNNEVKFAALVVQEYFNVTVYWQSFWTVEKGHRNSVRVVGTDEDQQLAKYIFDYLVQTFRACWNAALRSKQYHIRDRHVYMLGLYHGVTRRIGDDRAKVNQERALMVIGNKLAQRKRYMDKTHGELKDAKMHQNDGNPRAYQAGYVTGKALQVNSGLKAPVEKDKKKQLEEKEEA